MPLLIRELHIKVNLNAPAASQGGEGGLSKAAAGNEAKAAAANKETRESVVAECVEQVLEILSRKNEP